MRVSASWGLLVLGLGTTGLGAAMTVYLPEMRLDAERAAARREGLPTTPEEVRAIFGVPREKDNAAPLIRLAALRGGEPSALESGSASRVIEGRARASDRDVVRRWLSEKPDVLRLWREATLKPALSAVDLDAAPSTRMDVAWPPQYEIFHRLYLGQTRLLAATALGISPRENVVAAARLAALAKQEPGLGGQSFSCRSIKGIFIVAKQARAVSEVRKAFGPPIDARLAVATMLSDLLLEMDIVRSPDWRRRHSPTWPERVRQLPIFATTAKIRAIRAWRRVWRELPRDGKDYVGIAATLDRLAPTVDEAVGGYSREIQAVGRLGKVVRFLATCEATRQAAR